MTLTRAEVGGLPGQKVVEMLVYRHPISGQNQQLHYFLPWYPPCLSPGKLPFALVGTRVTYIFALVFSLILPRAKPGQIPGQIPEGMLVFGCYLGLPWGNVVLPWGNPGRAPPAMMHRDDNYNEFNGGIRIP